MTDLVPAITAYEDLHLIAVTPADMEKNQAALIQWCDGRLGAMKVELAELEEKIRLAKTGGMSTAAWLRHAALARAKMVFYRKVRAALQAGYYIVPPFPVQLFAIRTKRYSPRRMPSDWPHADREQKAEKLDIGIGSYRNPDPVVLGDSYETRDKEGKQITKTNWYADSWRKGVDFPFALAKPEIIEATAKALKEKIFDTLGVLPSYRTSDPIIVGQIISPNGDPLTFFVAWWLNTAGL